MTNQPRPFTIRIFVPDGNPDGLRTVEKSSWTGIGVVCPRAVYPEAKKREEFDRTGVYVLVGSDEASGEPILYIGEGDPVKPRLDQHYSKKDFWEWVIFFTAKDGSLNKAHVKYLESRLVAVAKEAKRVSLDNTQDPQLPTLSESETADAESFLLDMLPIFPLVGLTAFEKPRRLAGKKNLLRISSKGIVATGYESPQGFVVCKKSEAVLDEVASIHRFLSAKRSKLVEQGVLVEEGGRYVFLQDYEFSSPSHAAGVVQGRPANGRRDWKDAEGRSLKELQDRE